MSWTVNDILELSKKLTRKNQAGGISATDLFYMWNTEQNMYWQDLIGRWQQRSNTKSGTNTGLILNEISLTDLAPFTIPAELTVDESGFADKPEDFGYRVSLRIDDFKVSFIRPDQISYVTGSVIDEPNAETDTYYATEYEDYYKFIPNGAAVSAATLDYVALCNDIKWGFTLDANNRQVYNAGTSIQPKWSVPTIIEITKRALINFGISFKDADFINFGRTAQQTGD